MCIQVLYKNFRKYWYLLAWRQGEEKGIHRREGAGNQGEDWEQRGGKQSTRENVLRKGATLYVNIKLIDLK